MQVIQLLTFRINDTDFFFTNLNSDYTYEGHRYKAGVWAGLKSFEQRSKPVINEHSITLNDSDLSLASTTYAGKWQWQELKVKWLVLNNAGGVIDSFFVMQGAIISPDNDEKEDSRTLTLRVQENHTLEQVYGHRTNTASQHQVDPTDNGFDVLPFLDGVKLPWGKEGNGVVYIPNADDAGGVENNQNEFSAVSSWQRSPRYGAPVEP